MYTRELWLALFLLGCGEKETQEPGQGDSAAVDGDGDGYTLDQGDCDDADPAIHPGAEEVWYDGVDSDCGGEDDFDQDGDGFTQDAGDCDDEDPRSNPDGVESCGSPADENCDGDTNDLNAEDCTPWYFDQDGDGFGTDASLCLCEGDEASGFTAPLGTDCDDATKEINPGVAEVCDDKDNNCDGAVDEGVIQTYYRDRDKDGYGKEALQACTLPRGYVELGGDCDDDEDELSPGATEICDSIDNNCDTLIDDDDPALDLSTAEIWYQDSDGDGYGVLGTDIRACLQPSGYASNSRECDDADSSVHPGAVEACDSTVDLNCNGVINGTLSECTEGYSGEHEILLDYDSTKAVSCDAVWTDVGTSITPCPTCVWAFELSSTFEPGLSTDGGIVGASCYDYTGSADFTWSLGYDPDIYGYGFAYLWYYSTTYSAWYPFAYASLDSSGIYLDWVQGYGYYYQYPYFGYYYTNVFRGSATVQ